MYQEKINSFKRFLFKKETIMKRALFIILLLLFVPTFVFAQQVSHIASELGPGPTGVVYISTDTMITGEGVTLYFNDISTPSTPAFLGSYKMKSMIQSIILDGKNLYVVTNDSLSILDITSIGGITLKGSINSTGNQIKLAGDSLYYLQSNSIDQYDVSDPANPVSIHTYSGFTGPLFDFDVCGGVTGDTLFIIDYDFLRIRNYEGATTTTIGTDLSLSGTPVLNSIQKVNSQLYIANKNGIARIDVSVASAAAVDGTYLPGNSISGLFWLSDSIYAVTDSIKNNMVWKIEAVDGSNTLTAVDSFTVFDPNVSISGLCASGTSLLLAGGGFGWELIDINTELPVNMANTRFEVMNTTADSGYVFAAQRFTGIQVFSYNISTLNAETTYQPNPKKDYQSVLRYKDLLIAGYHLGIEVFDLSGLPTTITSVKDDNSIGQVYHMVFRDSVLVLGMGQYIKFYDLNTITGTVSQFSSAAIDLGGGNKCEDLWIGNGRLYVATDNNGLQGYNITDMNSASANILNYTNQTNISSVTVTDNDSIAFIANEYKVIGIDIANPASPSSFAGWFDIALPGTQMTDIILSGEYILAMHNTKGLFIIDATDPANLVQKSLIPVQPLPTKMSMHGFFLFAGYEIGMDMFKNPFGSALFKSSKFSTFTDADTIPFDINLINQMSKDRTDTNAYSFEFKLHFDQTLIDTIADVNGNLALDLSGSMLDGAGYTIFSNYITGVGNIDTIMISGAHSVALASTPDRLLTILFKPGPVATVDTVADIDFDEFYLNEGFPHSDVKYGFIVYKPRIGDVSYNKEVSGFDASLVLQHTVQLISIPNDSVIWADVSNNGMIQAFDAALILQYVAGIITSFPAEANYIFTKPAFSEPEAAIISYNYNYDETDGILSIPVSVENSSDVYSAEIELSHSGIEYKGYEIEKNCSHFISAAEDKEGNLKLAMAGAAPVQKDGEIVTLYFKVNKKSDLDKLAFNGITLNEFKYDVSEIESNTIIPKTFRIHQNYPNPFNPVTNIKYELPNTGNITLKIYNLLGQEVKTLVNKIQASGFYKLQWDGRNNHNLLVSSGVYFYKIEYRPSSGNEPKVFTKKLLFMK